MIKTLIAIGLTVIGGFNNLRPDTTYDQVIEIEGNNSYIGPNAQRYLNDYEYQYLLPYVRDYTISDALNTHTGLNTTIPWVFKKENTDMQAYALLMPNNTTYNLVELVKFSFIRDHRNDSTPSDVIDFGIGNWRDPDNNTITKSITPSSYTIITALVPKNYNTEIDYKLKQSTGPQIEIWDSSYIYNVRTYQMNGLIVPFNDLGSKNTTNMFKSNTNNESGTNNEIEQLQQVVNTWFISKGQIFNEFNINGKIDVVENGLQLWFKYAYSTYENSLNNYKETVNTVNTLENSDLGIQEWILPDYQEIILLESDRPTYINGIYQYQYGSLINHITNRATIQISGSSSITNIFDLVANAFNGFGNFFNVTILPGITLGAIITIPLLIGLILWLINMFKRH